MDKLFNPKNDRKYVDNQEIEFDEDTKIRLLNEINTQFLVSKEHEMKLRRGLIANVTDKTVPRVPKVLQSLCRKHIRKESQLSPIKYEHVDEGKVVKIRQRFDKEILEQLPKLKFLNKTGIQPDYEDKDIEKPRPNLPVCSFSRSKTKRDGSRNVAVPHSLDGLEPDKLLKDRLKISPRNDLYKAPVFDKQLSRQQIERLRKGIPLHKKEYSKIDEDLWIERLNMFADRAVEQNNSIKQEMDKFVIRDISLQIVKGK